MKGRTIKRTMFTQEQIIDVLKEAKAGTKRMASWPGHSVSEATIYHTTARYGGLEVPKRSEADAAI